MKFREFESIIKNLPTFNLNDVRKVAPDFHRQQLTYWQETGYIKPFVGGYYLLKDRKRNEFDLFVLANKVYEPSYISLESALSYYKIIPETVFGVTSICTRKTNRFDTEWGRLTYRSVKPQLMIGYEVITVEKNKKFKIASLEKTILDYLYLNVQIQSIEDFEELRWNRIEIRNLIDPLKFEKYMRIFENKSLETRAKRFWEYIDA